MCVCVWWNMPWRTRYKENSPPLYLHTLNRRHERKAKSTQTYLRIHSQVHTYTIDVGTERKALSICLFRSLTVLSPASLTAFTFTEDNHHHSSNALEQLLGLCSVVSQSTTNNVWLVEKVEWNGATASKNKRKRCSLHIGFTHTHSSNMNTCMRRSSKLYIHTWRTHLQNVTVLNFEVWFTHVLSTLEQNKCWISGSVVARRSHGIERLYESSTWERQWTTTWRV